MLIPQITTLRTEDFPSEKEWISKLLFPLNQFLLNATSAINGNITFTDNIPCQTQTLSFTYGSSADFPKTFKWNISNNKPIELRVCSATENSVAIAVLPTWSYTNSVVTITGFVKLSSSGASGLTVGASYNIVVRGQP